MRVQFDGYSLDTDRRELRRGDALIPIQPQVFDLLEYLIANRDRVISKDDLIFSIWKGRIVSESTLLSRINAARRAIGDDGEQQRLIRTVARKGVRFVGTVLTLPTEESPALALPDRPSIAVLPFQNMSSDPEQEYFADGVVEDIITALSRDRGLFVIARNSSFTYKGRAVDIRQVGRELGVRYVLEGSVRKAANKVRITGELIEAETGSHVWADHFDGSLKSIFDLQDEIANKVAAIICPAVEQAEFERSSRKTTDLQAYDLYLRAKAAFYGTTLTEQAEAIHFAERALELDPKFARCHALIAAIHRGQFMGSLSSNPDVEAAAALLAAQRALALDGNDATVFMQYGATILFVRGHAEAEEALSLLDQAIDLDPNLATAWTFRGICKGNQGKVDEAIDDLEHALRLSPRDPRRWVAQHGLASLHLTIGRYDQAILWASTVFQLQPNIGITLRVAIAAHALAGRLDKAHEILAKHRTIEPESRISTLREAYLRRLPPKAFETLADGLRKAGFPE